MVVIQRAKACCCQCEGNVKSVGQCARDQSSTFLRLAQLLCLEYRGLREVRVHHILNVQDVVYLSNSRSDSR